MNEYSVYFNPPGFDDYPRAIQDTIDYVALNANVEKPPLEDIYFSGPTLSGNEDINQIWINVPEPATIPSSPLPPLPSPTGVNATRIISLAAQPPPGIGSSNTIAFDINTGVRDASFVTSGQSIGNSQFNIIPASNSKFFVSTVLQGFAPATCEVFRINANGSLDTSFTPSIYNGLVNGLLLQTDGKLLVYGNFSTCNSVAAICIARLSLNGSRDTTFASGTGVGVEYASGQSVSISSAALQADGNILIAGNFTRYQNAGIPYSRTGVARITPTASLDLSFQLSSNAGFGDNPSILVRANQTILVGGIGSVQSFLPTGALDPNFSSPYLGVGTVESMAEASDSKIYAAGTFRDTSTQNVSGSAKLVRLFSGGGKDSSFQSPFPTYSLGVFSVIVLKSGAIFARGALQQGTFVQQFVKLNLDGTVNNSFSPSVTLYPFKSRQSIVALESPAISSSSYASGVSGFAFSYTIVASPIPITLFSTTSLPLGLTLNSSTGVISGTPTTPGIYPVVLSVTNSSGVTTMGLNIEIFGSTPTSNLNTPALRRYNNGQWLEFSSIRRGDIIIAPEDQAIIFPWGESGRIYNLEQWGESSNFTVPTLPTPPTGFKYKYYIGALMAQTPPPIITP